MAKTLKDLSSDDRMRLMRFACSFAWADLEIRPKERDLVRKLQKQLELSGAEIAQAEEWLKIPPRPEDVDPTSVPREHRALFLQAAREMIGVDGEIDPEEAETFELFKQLLA